MKAVGIDLTFALKVYSSASGSVRTALSTIVETLVD